MAHTMTRGRRILLSLLQRISGREVAVRCRVSRASVSHWASGKKRPNMDHRRAIQQQFGLSIKSWNESS